MGEAHPRESLARKTSRFRKIRSVKPAELDLDAPPARLDAFLIPRSLRSLPVPQLGAPMDAVFILLTLALFASSLAFVRLCDRV
jgi:hypothetical protein